MVLRLKGERDDEVIETCDPDEITWRDAFAESPPSGDGGDEGSEGDAGEGGGTALLRGLRIAAAAFVPTFLAVFFGLPHLLGSPPPAPPSDQPAPIVTAPPTPAPEVAPPESMPSDSGDRGRALRVEPPASAEPTPPALSLPPATPRTPKSPPRRASEGRRPLGLETQQPDGEWSPAAAFADRNAADRLASSIRARGRRVEIRADGSSTQPWVVWVRAEPSSTGPRRR
jgi:hypothetical protein